MKTLELTRGRYQAGLGNILEVTQSEALLATTEAKIPPLEISVRRSIHRLAALAGLAPEALRGGDVVSLLKSKHEMGI